MTDLIDTFALAAGILGQNRMYPLCYVIYIQDKA